MLILKKYIDEHVQIKKKQLLYKSNKLSYVTCQPKCPVYKKEQVFSYPYFYMYIVYIHVYRYRDQT